MELNVNDQPLVEARGITVEYPARRGLIGRLGESVRAVDNISISIQRGDTLGLVGESGCGKTSVGRALLLLERPVKGQVLLDGKDLTAMNRRDLRNARRHMQLIYQDPQSSLDPRLTVRDIVGEPLAIHKTSGRRERDERVRELLDTVGLSLSDLDRYPHQFSGGQRQRIGIARALALNPAFVVCDEPTSALDVSIRAQILNLLTELQAKLQLTYLFIAHDLAVIDHVSDGVAVMYLGRIVELATPQQLRFTPRHPYTVALLSAMPIANPEGARAARRIVLQGELPSPSDPPQGCAFHTRCWLYQRMGSPEVCRTDNPGLQDLESSHKVACHFSGQTDLTEASSLLRS